MPFISPALVASVTFGRFMSPKVTFMVTFPPPTYWAASPAGGWAVYPWAAGDGIPNFSRINSGFACESSHSLCAISLVNTMSPCPTFVSVPSFLLKCSSSFPSPRNASWSYGMLWEPTRNPFIPISFSFLYRLPDDFWLSYFTPSSFAAFFISLVVSVFLPNLS